jgi:DICT domain-containing protein
MIAIWGPILSDSTSFLGLSMKDLRVSARRKKYQVQRNEFFSCTHVSCYHQQEDHPTDKLKGWDLDNKILIVRS